jgi:hypothetical protein
MKFMSKVLDVAKPDCKIFFSVVYVLTQIWYNTATISLIVILCMIVYGLSVVFTNLLLYQ